MLLVTEERQTIKASGLLRTFQGLQSWEQLCVPNEARAGGGARGTLFCLPASTCPHLITKWSCALPRIFFPLCDRFQASFLIVPKLAGRETWAKRNMPREAQVRKWPENHKWMAKAFGDHHLLALLNPWILWWKWRRNEQISKSKWFINLYPKGRNRHWCNLGLQQSKNTNCKTI